MRFLELFVHDPKNPLVFNTGTFFLLFTVFMIVFALLRGRNALRLGWLLLFSLYYYYKCNGVFMLTLLALTAADWAIALRVHRQEDPGRRKAWLTVSVVLNLAALGFFKYTNFFLRNVSALTGAHVDPLDIFLPIGISFHIFQSLSYLVDVYRRLYPPTKSLFEYALFLSFFPQIVAGPIVRAPEFFSQIHPIREPAPDDVAAGLYRIVQGVAKKALIADYVGIYSDLVFAAPETYSGPEVLLGIYAYAIQIYFDFSGYSDMALGMARILGVKISENFDSPYGATSITEFWRRWHISLSSWLRDYLYIPLGGNRAGPVRKYVNLMLTMLLGGLWHGASWNFVVWGGLHGVGLAVHKYVDTRWPARGARWRRVLGWVVTLHFVAALWVFFRAKDFSTAFQVFERLAVEWEPARIVTMLEVRHWVVAALALGFVASALPTSVATRLQGYFVRVPLPVKALVFVALLQCVVQVQGTNIQPFIYFQF
ncbi:MAG: MBOAT family protein [Myxococcales bacterium]|nr:MBOAT family protein [Myxococcales bacterium]